MIQFMIENIRRKLSMPINQGFGIKRYENDSYIEGNPWVVTTLWLSEAMFALALDLPREIEEKYDETVNKLTSDGIKFLKCALAGATSTGLLPEQMDKSTGKPAWAVPLGWSESLMLDNILLLDKICTKRAGSKEQS
jgi:GH15 family glucan-1,4-alpha-glucosidase